MGNKKEEGINQKNYKDKATLKLIRKYFKEYKKSYDSKWKGLLEEVFLRRTYELGLSKEELAEDLYNFTANIDTIRFAPKEVFSKETTMGHCDYNANEICINEDYFKTNLTGGWVQRSNNRGSRYVYPKSKEEVAQMIYSTFAHEVEHGARRVVGKNEYGLAYYDSEKRKWEGHGLDEVFVETAANRCSVPRTADDVERFRSETDGYGDITFVSNILAATYGKTEKEALRAGSRGRDTLVKTLIGNLPGQQRALDSFNAIESSLDLIYNAGYKDEKNVMNEFNENVIQSGLKGIYSNSIWELTKQIEETTQIDDMKTYMADIVYRRMKIEKIMEDAISKNVKHGRLSETNSQQIYEYLQPFRLELAKRIDNVNTVYRCNSLFNTPEEYEQAMELARKGEIDKYSDWYEQKYGLDLRTEVQDPLENSITQDLEYDEYVLREDFDNGKQWDNNGVSEYMISKFKKEMFYPPRAINSDDAKTEELESITETLVPVDDWVTTELLETVKESPLQKARRVIGQFFTRLANRNVKRLAPGDAYTMQEHYTNLAIQSSDGYSDIDRKMDKPIIEELPNTLDQYKIDGPTPVYDERFSSKVENDEKDKDR